MQGRSCRLKRQKRQKGHIMKKAIATIPLHEGNLDIIPGDFVYYKKSKDISAYLISKDEKFEVGAIVFVDDDYIDSLADPEFYDPDLIYAVYRINETYSKIDSAVDCIGDYFFEKYEFLIDKFARELQMSPARLEDIATDVRYLGWFED